MNRFLLHQKNGIGFFKKLGLFVFLCFFSLGVRAQCPSGSLTLSSQAQVDAFATNYPNCTEISGGLFIYATNIADLSPLSNLTSVGGYLYIAYNSNLTNLDGLSNLTSIGGALIIDANNALTDISGLQNINPASILSTNGTGLYVVDNPLLSVCNLPNFCEYLTNTSGTHPRTISDNAGDCVSEAAVAASCIPACETPTTLTATPTSVSATLGWTSDGALFDIEWGVAGFTPGSGTMVTDIATNSYNLTDLNYETQYQFYVRCQNTDTWVGPKSFTTLPQCPSYAYVVLQSQAQIDSFGVNYPNCTNLNENIVILGSINNNTNITNLNGFSNIISVKSLMISRNNNLTNLDDLNNLTNVENLDIYSNINLSDISGLANIDPTTITYLQISGNSNLSVCNLPNFCTYLRGSGERHISYNLYWCSNSDIIISSCPVTCEVPTNLSTINVTSVSATLNWSGTGTYDIEWGTQGFTQGSGTTVTDIATNSYNLTNLNGYTQYQFYVRCQSEPDNWVGPRSFTTLPQCPSGDVYLTSQAEVDAFGVNYPNCTEISGGLFIYGNITDLSPLSNLTSIGGHLQIYNNSNLTNLDGLSNLTSIGGYLTIYNNQALTDISGLQNINPASIISSNYGLYITFNTSLSVCNLPNFCTYLTGSGPRTIWGNAGDCVSEEAVNAACAPACEVPTTLTATPTSVSATLGWTSTGNNFDIEWGVAGFIPGSGTTVTDIATNSYNLTNLDYATQYQFYVRQDCSVNESDWAGPFSFTTQLQCPTGDVYLSSQAAIDAFATNYPNCTQITGNLHIQGVDITNLLPLSNITNVGGYLAIMSNPQLTQIGGLSSLTTLGGFIAITDNPQLINLNELSSLTSIGGDINIQNNNVLNNIAGLQNINPATIQSVYGYGLYIVNNPNLSVCDLNNFCVYLSNPLNTRTISGNAGDCISEAAVMVACNSCETPFNFDTPVTSVSANLNWTGTGTYVIEWGEVGFAHGTGNIVSGISANNYQLSSLDSDTEYEFYIRCQNTDTWVGPIGFTTLPQCPGTSGWLWFTTQASIDEFEVNYPNCTHIDATNVLIGMILLFGDPTDITNVDGLSSIISISGSLNIGNNPILTNLNGLNNLNSVGADLTIDQNSSFVDFNGLNSLTHIGGKLDINNSDLTNLNGLSNLESVGSIYLENNNSLIDISGLENINPSTFNDLEITDNPNLSVCNLPNLCTYLLGSGGRSISGNEGDCISAEALAWICNPTCDVPTNLFVSDHGTHSVTLGWTGDDEKFDIEWGIAGFSVGTGAHVTDIEANSYSLSDLDPGTHYQFYVRSQCIYGVSEWAGPFTFNTLLLGDSSLTNELFAFGYGGYGQMGVGNTNNQLTPIHVISNKDWKEISANDRHVLAIKSDGTLWAWGTNEDGQLGTGNTNNQLVPVQIGTDTDWKQVSAGYRHSVALKTDGTLWGWGSGQWGQLGMGNTNSHLVPVQVGSDSDWQQVSTARYHTHAIKTNGTLWAWGIDYYNILGTGNTDPQHSPVQISTATNWKQVSAHNYASMGLKSDGTIWTWGFGAYAQMGNGTDQPQYVPTQVGSANDWQFISAGSGFFGIKSNGTLWGWGSNNRGNVGNGTTSHQYSPMQIGTANDWKQVSAGANHTIGIKNDGSLWAWGEGSNGATGTGNTTQQNVPVLISSETYSFVETGTFVSFVLRSSLPPCEVPTDLAATEVSEDTALISWESDGDLFDIEWGGAGFVQGEGVSVNEIQGTTYELSPLTAGAQYEFYVRQKCTENDSQWAGPFAFSITANCPSGDVVLLSQAEVEDFAEEFPGCTVIDGDLTITGADITDLSPISHLTGIAGNLQISNTQLVNLNAFSNLSYIGGDLNVSENDGLAQLLGSSGLTSIGGDLHIAYNPELENLSGLNGVTQIGGGTTITNTSLVNFNQLSSITTIGGNLLISENAALTGLTGLDNLTGIDGYLDIINNPVLSDLNSLSNLTQIGDGNFYIQNNAQLTNIFGLHNLDFSNMEGVYIYENANLSVCNIANLCDYLSSSEFRYIVNNTGDCEDEAVVILACANPQTQCPDGDVILASQQDVDAFAVNYPFCTEISGNLIIGNEMDATDITDLSPLSSITGIGGNLGVFSTQITNLEELTNLNSIGGNLQVWENGQLISLFGHELTDFDGYLDIRNAGLLESLSGFANTTTLSGLSIDYTSLTNFDDLSNLTTIGSDGFYIAYNFVLSDLSGLSNLTTIGGSVYISDTYELTTLDGLNNLNSIAGNLYIGWNEQLSDISALANIDYTTIEFLEISYNWMLSECSLPSFCTYFANSGEGDIYGNTGDCENIEAFEDACNSWGNCDAYTIWNGTSWSNGEPDTGKGAVIQGDLTLTTEMVACEILIHSGVFTINPEAELTVNGAIKNNLDAEYFIVESDGILIQIEEDVENIGEITVIRESQPMVRLDYTLWSSPVTGQNLFGFSPETVNGVTNYPGSDGRIYIYDGANGYVNPNPFNAESVMEDGAGYLFRSPNNWSPTDSAPYVGVFTGVANNGNIQVTTHAGNYTSIGNPYLSNIRLNDLYVANPDINAVYFWNNIQSTGNNYATCTNGMGCVAAAGGGNTPNGILTTGQGFIVHTDANSVSFDNSMRVNDSGIFFKVDELESHRFWLNLDGENESYNQILVGYVSEATHNIDLQIDGKLFNYEGSALYNLIDEEQFVIQGRALPFESTDIVPLGFRAVESGKFKISLANFDGLFVEGSVSIYLKDNQLDITHNLMESDYEFESASGEFKERFEVVYQTEGNMGTGDFDSNLVQIYQNENQIIIESKTEKILSVELFDLHGRNLHRNAKVNANHYQIESKAFGTHVLVVKVQTEKGEILTKKLISK